MKKYSKPMIAFESFTLSTNIAGDCKTQTTDFTDFNECGIWFEGEGMLFVEPWGGCEVKPAPSTNGIYGQYCYDIPTGATPLFNS